MGDSSVGKVAEAISQSVAKPVIDEFKTDLEVVAQSVSANPLTTQQNPQQNQHNQQQTQNQQSQSKDKDQQEIQRIRNWIANLQNAQGKVRQETKQKEAVLKQQEEEKMRKEVAEEEQRKQTIPSPAGPTRVPGIFTPRKKVREDIARTQPELRAGHGSGG